MEEELLATFLQETGGQADYLEGIPTSQLQHGRLMGIYDRVGQEGSFLVTSHYATLANAVAGDPTPTPEVIHTAVRIIHKGMLALKQELGAHGENVENFSPAEVTRHRRSLAVMVYLVHRALCGMEAKSVQHVLGSGNVGGKGGRPGSGKTAAFGGNADAAGINWRNLRTMIIEDILAILELPVEKIWDDSGYGYSVPRLLIRTMCSNFNEPCLAKENLRAGDEPHKIFALIAQRFKKPADVYQRLYPLIKYGEDVAKLVSRSVEIMANDFKLEDAVAHAFQAITSVVETDIVERNKNSALAEKGAAQLLGDMCELTPKDVILRGGFYLVQLLKADSVAIRSASCVGSGHLLRYLKNIEGGPTANVKLRNQILEDILVRHTRDVNSLIRAKCLQVLARLIEENLLEPVEVAVGMAAAIDRLNDSAVLSRKYSFTLIKNIVAKFPGICSTAINFKEEVDKHRKRLLELMAKTSLRKSYYVYAIVCEFTEQIRVHDIPLPEAHDEAIEEGMASVRPLIANLVRDDKYWDACNVLYHTFQKYGSEAGIAEAGKSAAIPSMYISYFNTVTNGGDDNGSANNSQRSMLNDSFDISKSMSSHDSELLENEEVAAEKKILQFSQGCLKMKLQLNSLLEKLTLLLQIGQPNDQTEAVATIGELVRCGYPVNDKITGPVIQAIAGLADESAGDLIPAFWSIFIGDVGIGNVQMIRNIFKILDSVETATKDLLKPMIGEMYVAGSLSKSAVVILWDAFNRTYATWSEHDAKNAIFVLGAIGRCDKLVITANFNILMKTGLGDAALNDMALVRYTLEAILFSLKATKKGESDIKTTHRLLRNHAIFDRLLDILVSGLTKKGNWETHEHFPRVAELAVQIIYRLSWDHIPFTNKLLATLPSLVFGGRGVDENGEVPESEIQDSEEMFIRYLAIMTALLGTHINYCETVIIPELKRRRMMMANSTDLMNAMSKSVLSTTTASSASASMVRGGRSGLNLTNNASRLSTVSTISTAGANSTGGGRGRGAGRGRRGRKSTNAATNVLAEMEAILGSTGFDGEVDIVKSYVEKLLDQGTFQQLRRLTLYFCQKITTVQHRKLKLAIVNAVAKLMLVSADSVGKLIDPFINLWNIVDDNRVKVEILKHLTVLNVRFPNQVERCNVIIKSGLMNDNTHIKTACLDFMGYLALGDMVKIRDSIAEVALCLTSEKLVIRELARDFFDVCAEKDNVISNAVPEVISQLSNRVGLSQLDFQGIMKFLLVRVKKEKQVLGLAETLVGRFKGPAQTERLWEDNAYCLSQLPQGEKTFKIIRDSFPLYSDKLENEAVFNSFLHIVETLKRTMQKPEIKAKIEDYERDLEEYRERAMENNRIAAVKNRQQKKKRRSDSGDDSSLMEDRQAVVDEDEEQDVEEEEGDDDKDQEAEADNSGNEEKSVNKNKKQRNSDTDDEKEAFEDDEDEEEVDAQEEEEDAQGEEAEDDKAENEDTDSDEDQPTLEDSD